MNARVEQAKLFASLHRKGAPLILFNIWDAGSAKIVAEAGAKAIATGSWSVAGAHGYADGEKMPLDLVLANLRRIVAAVPLPVTIDFERGYAAEPAAVADNVLAAIEAGAIGCNLEDGAGGAAPLATDAQCARIAAIRVAADGAGLPFFINARTDLFLTAGADSHEDRFEEALARAHAYAEAGADGLFVPGLVDEALIEKVCAATRLPVNVLIWPGLPATSRLAALGIARISHGASPWRLAMQTVAEAARNAHQGG